MTLPSLLSSPTHGFLWVKLQLIVFKYQGLGTNILKNKHHQGIKDCLAMHQKSPRLTWCLLLDFWTCQSLIEMIWIHLGKLKEFINRKWCSSGTMSVLNHHVFFFAGGGGWGEGVSSSHISGLHGLPQNDETLSPTTQFYHTHRL